MKTKFLVIGLALGTFLCLYACGEDKKASSSNNPVEKELSPMAMEILGEKVFKNNCVACHGLDGKLGLNGAKDLALSTMTMDERIALIKNGKGVMIPFQKILNKNEIKSVAKYSIDRFKPQSNE